MISHSSEKDCIHIAILKIKDFVEQVAGFIPTEAEIADALHISENTVRGHIKTGYEIVGATSRHQAFQKLIARADE